MTDAAPPDTKLAVEWAPIDSVIPHPDNKRKGNLDTIRGSLRRHGQYKPIVVQASTRHIIAGNHTWKGAKEEGWEGIWIALRDVDDDEALRILLVDNKAPDDATYDDRGLAEVLAQFGDDLEGTGWTQDEAAELRRVTGQLADESAGFLDGLSPDGYGGSRGGDREYHQLGWPVTADQRDVILLALRYQRESMPEVAGERPTTIDALVAMCQAHVDREERKRRMKGDSE